MIYTDGVHLVADSVQELHSFAARVGLRSEWFQNHPRHPHYDITTTQMVNKVIRCGAQHVSTRILLKVSHALVAQR